MSISTFENTRSKGYVAVGYDDAEASDLTTALATGAQLVVDGNTYLEGEVELKAGDIKLTKYDALTEDDDPTADWTGLGASDAAPKNYVDAKVKSIDASALTGADNFVTKTSTGLQTIQNNLDVVGDLSAGTITSDAGLTVTTGGASITGNSTVTGSLGVSTTLTVTGDSEMKQHVTLSKWSARADLASFTNQALPEDNITTSDAAPVSYVNFRADSARDAAKTYADGIVSTVSTNLTTLSGEALKLSPASDQTITANNLILSAGDVALSKYNGLTTTSAIVTAGLGANEAAPRSYVDAAVNELVDAAPSALNTLKELAAALGNDENFATTVTTSIGTAQTTANSAVTAAANKLDLTSGTTQSVAGKVQFQNAAGIDVKSLMQLQRSDKDTTKAADVALNLGGNEWRMLLTGSGLSATVKIQYYDDVTDAQNPVWVDVAAFSR